MRWILLIFLVGCSTAKTQYVETKYDLCIQKCTLKYSKYEYQKLNSCKAKCSQEKYNFGK
ncbi:MAG: hypothetical protein GY909_11855 [Oligoflexia bacterium]|jgi:hypothetical protein|nr:hypothetical protein [Oligoflexia bacterium]